MNNGFLHLAFNASFLVQMVMIILIGLSIWSWTTWSETKGKTFRFWDSITGETETKRLLW